MELPRRRAVLWGYLLVATVALALQAVYLLQSSQADPSFQVPVVDAASYHQMATDFARGAPLEDGACWQPPLWPLLLGVIYRICGISIVTAKILLACLGAGSCMLLCRLAGRLFSPRVGILAGLLLACYGPFVFFQTQLLPTGPAVFLNLLALVLLLSARERGGWWRWLLCGAVVGAATITVPNAIVLLPVMLGWELLSAERGKRLRPVLARGALMCAGVVLLIAPVTLRNYLVSGEFVPISTNGGINFYIGNNPEADRTIAIRPGVAWRRLTRSYLAQGSMTANERNSYFWKRGLSYLADDPRGFATGLGRKTLRLLNAREIPRNVDPHVHGRYSSLLGALLTRAGPIALPFGILAPLGVVGVLVSLRRAGRPESRGQRLAVLAFGVLYGLSIVAFFVSSRYRLPLAPIVVLFAAGGIDWLWTELRGRTVTPGRWRGLAWGGLVVAGLLVNRPIRTPTDHVDFHAELYCLLGAAELKAEHYDEATRHLEQALTLDPRSADAHTWLADLALQQGKRDRAADHLRQALLLDPDAVEALRLRGDLRRREGKLQDALVSYEAALKRDPFAAEAHAGLAETLYELGRGAEALPHYRLAVRLLPRDARLLIHFADVLAQAEEYEEALEHYRKGIELSDPEPEPEVLNRVAWLLATCPQTELRNGRVALDYAKHVCRSTDYRNARALDTLAAAHAQCGRFADAVRVARQAQESAQAAGDEEHAQAVKVRLAMYERHLPR